MTDRTPRIELADFRGGADDWDQGQAGALATADFFGASEGPVAHATTGTLQGPAGATAGTASRARLHATKSSGRPPWRRSSEIRAYWPR